jgi:mannose-1-phosphate guanylyltransferase
MQAVILVGGEGTRLRPLTYTIPKPLIPMMNLPFLSFQIELCKRFGIMDIILSTNYLSSVFEEVFGDGSEWGVKLTFVTEKEPLDTCGAVKNVERYIHGPFLVFNGDVLTDLDLSRLIEYHQEKRAIATLTLVRVEDPSAYGLVPLDSEGRIREFLEKPGPDQLVTNLINAGTYVLEPEVLDRVPPGQRYSFERQLFPSLLQEGEAMFGYPSEGYWIDIGTPRKYLAAHRDILEGKLDFQFPGREIKPSVWVGEGTVIEEGARVYGPSLIGRNCHIRGQAVIYSHSVLGDDCCVGRGATIERAVLLQGVHVGEDSVISESVLGRYVRLGKRVHVEGESVLGEGVKVGDGNELKRGIRVWPHRELSEGSLHF